MAAAFPRCTAIESRLKNDCIMWSLKKIIGSRGHSTEAELLLLSPCFCFPHINMIAEIGKITSRLESHDGWAHPITATGKHSLCTALQSFHVLSCDNFTIIYHCTRTNLDIHIK